MDSDDVVARTELLSEHSAMTRRSALGLLGMVGLGALFSGSAQAASVYLNGRLVSGGEEAVSAAATGARSLSAGAGATVGRVTSGSAIAVSDVARSLPGYARYVEFLTKHNLRRVDIAKVIESHAKERGGVHNTLPPMSLWRNLSPTLRVADAIAQRLGEDVEQVISAYRCPRYNQQCRGGASHSQHMRNGALDLVFASSPSRVAKVAKTLRAEGLFAGGIGLYPGFTHVDTRGVNADW